VPASPQNDSIARVLREHFDTEAVDAGLRSPDWQSGGIRSASSPDAGMFARAIRFRQDEHRRVREALARVSPEHREALELAYGVAFRERDVDDGSRRRALRTSERNWRVRLREIYDFPECAVVLASNLARSMFRARVATALIAADDAIGPLDDRVDRLRRPGEAYDDTPEQRARLRGAVLPPVARFEQQNLGAWLLTSEAREHASAIEANALELLEQARRAFASVYEPPRGLPRLDAAPPRRTRRVDWEKLRRQAEEDDGGGFTV
jgi:hypothetical protein